MYQGRSNDRLAAPAIQTGFGPKFLLNNYKLKYFSEHRGQKQAHINSLGIDYHIALKRHQILQMYIQNLISAKIHTRA